MMAPKILLMAGGTGGHIFPALAVAVYLQKQGWATRWLGSKNGMEEQLVPKYNIPLDTLSVAGVRGKSIVQRLLSPFMLMHTLWQAIKILRAYRPDVVLGMGGFASGPGGLAARVLGVPLCVHEQNAIAGMTNRWLARIAKYRLEAFPGSLPKADEAVGNPVRQEITDLIPPAERFAAKQSDNLNLLIIGGSRGAAILNEVVPQAVALLAAKKSINVWHQTGAGNRGIVHQRYSDQGLLTSQKWSIEIDEFINDMAAAYTWADCVICRAGALTISELAAAGVASVLIPFPHAVDDHQTVNANYLVAEGAAQLLPQSELTQDSLAENIQSINERAICLSMSEAAYRVRKPEAVRRVAEYCAAAAGQSTEGWTA